MPRALTADDQQELKAYRDYFDPKRSAESVDTYGKWIFTAVASITALGSGLSNTAFQALDAHGRLVFGLAVIAAGISLASSVLLLTPQLSNVNRWSMDSMRTAIDHINQSRRVYVIVAGWTLALALVLAAVAPIVTAYYPAAFPEPEVQYSLSANKLTVTAALSGLLPKSNVLIEVRRVSPSPETTLGQATLAASDKGVAKATIEAPLSKSGKVRISYQATNQTNEQKAGAQEFTYDTATQ
jgi:hypothetical protein